MLQLRPRSDFGRLMLLVPEPLAGARARREEFSRDEFLTSDKDQGVFEQLHFMNFLLVHASTGSSALFVRAASRCV